MRYNGEMDDIYDPFTWPWQSRRRCSRGRRPISSQQRRADIIPKISKQFRKSPGSLHCKTRHDTHSVVLPEEDVTDDPDGAERGRDVKAGERAKARALDVEDVIAALEFIVLSVDDKLERRERGDLLTVDRVLSVPRLGCANLLVQDLGNVRGKGDERCAGVDSSTGVVEIHLFVAKGDLVELDLPVTLTADGGVGNLALVTAVIHTAKDSLATVLLRVTKVESELGLIQKTLVDHLVEGRDDTVDADRVVGETEDTVKLAKGESKTGLRGSLGKVLTLDLQVADGQDVVGHDTLHGARTILDLEFGAVLLVRRRGRVVVLGVQEASDRRALGRGDPEVRRTSVENDLEGLGRSAKGDVGKVLRVHEVCEGHEMSVMRCKVATVCR